MEGGGVGGFYIYIFFAALYLPSLFQRDALCMACLPACLPAYLERRKIIIYLHVSQRRERNSLRISHNRLFFPPNSQLHFICENVNAFLRVNLHVLKACLRDGEIGGLA